MHSLSERFQQTLLDYSQEADTARREAMEAQLWHEYGAERAVLVLDMSGFSELSHRYGIVHYLSMVRRMQLTTGPIVQRYQGALVKFEADNGFAMFPTVDDAIEAALELNAAFATANEQTPDELDIRIACGIDYGRILVIEGWDFFGNAVNRASKLGEDLANAGEILVTQDAVQHLAAEHRHVLHPQYFEISGLRIDACRVATD